VAGMATFLSSILATFLGLGMWMPVGALGLLLAISGPSMLIAWLKLRQRNVGPILDANGWSVNALAKINIPFGSALTKVAALPQERAASHATGLPRSGPLGPVSDPARACGLGRALAARSSRSLSAWQVQVRGGVRSRGSGQDRAGSQVEGAVG